MNKVNLNTQNPDELLRNFVGKQVIVKLVNGRAISGKLKEDSGHYTIKLGVKHLQLNLSALTSIQELS